MSFEEHFKGKKNLLDSWGYKALFYNLKNPIIKEQ